MGEPAATIRGRGVKSPIFHPGEILLEDFMKPMGISARQFAADIDVFPPRISELVHGSRPISADTALRLGLFFLHGTALLAEPANGVGDATVFLIQAAG